MKKYLFISVKQEYANKILSGEKTIELRKSKPNISKGDHVIIYSTSPVKAILGIAQVGDLLSYSPGKMWKLHSKDLGISRKDFINYYSDSQKSIGIVLRNITKYEYVIHLETIKKIAPKFSPPQTFKYFKDFNGCSISPILTPI